MFRVYDQYICGPDGQIISRLGDNKVAAQMLYFSIPAAHPSQVLSGVEGVPYLGSKYITVRDACLLTLSAIRERDWAIQPACRFMWPYLLLLRTADEANLAEYESFVQDVQQLFDELPENLDRFVLYIYKYNAER